MPLATFVVMRFHFHLNEVQSVFAIRGRSCRCICPMRHNRTYYTKTLDASLCATLRCFSLSIERTHHT
jgi:hypothetical protein